MKKYILTLMILVSSCAVSADEVGIILGSATGLSAKFKLPQANRAIDLALAYKMNSTSSITIHGDYLIENARTFNLNAEHPFSMYYGLGLRLININSDGANKGKTSAGPRAPIGLEYKISNPDISFFGELAVAIDVIPSTLVEVLGGLGVRFRF